MVLERTEESRSPVSVLIGSFEIVIAERKVAENSS